MATLLLMNKTTIKIIATDWKKHQNQLSVIRFRVFVKEQKVPKEMEIDEQDPDALHFLVIDTDTDQAIAAGRLLANGHIGRMAVLKNYRNRKIGSRLLSFIINEAEKRNYHELFLNAQISAREFYEKNDFNAVGEQFMDAGIPHIRMQRTI
jgi:predicted GNAT family N-acyltransferase